MPELKVLEVNGHNIRKGDIVILPGTEVETSPIAVISQKNKYVWLDGEDGTKGRVGVSDKVTVKRMVPTEAEIAAESRAKTMHYLNRRVAQFEMDYDEARKAFAEKMNTPYGADHWDFEKLAFATASHRIWAKIAKSWENLQAKPDNKYTLRDVVQETINEFAYDILRDDRRLSGSTSTWSNTLESTEFTVKQQFIRDLVSYRTDLEVKVDTRNRYL